MALTAATPLLRHTLSHPPPRTTLDDHSRFSVPRDRDRTRHAVHLLKQPGRPFNPAGFFFPRASSKQNIQTSSTPNPLSPPPTHLTLPAPPSTRALPRSSTRDHLPAGQFALLPLLRLPPTREQRPSVFPRRKAEISAPADLIASPLLTFSTSPSHHTSAHQIPPRIPCRLARLSLPPARRDLVEAVLPQVSLDRCVVALVGEAPVYMAVMATQHVEGIALEHKTMPVPSSDLMALDIDING